MPVRRRSYRCAKGSDAIDVGGANEKLRPPAIVSHEKRTALLELTIEMYDRDTHPIGLVFHAIARL